LTVFSLYEAYGVLLIFYVSLYIFLIHSSCYRLQPEHLHCRCWSKGYLRSKLLTGRYIHPASLSLTHHSQIRHWAEVCHLVNYVWPLLIPKDLLEVALDVSSDGQLQLPPFPDNAPSAIWNITLFLSSYTTGKNFTISNGTATGGNASLGEVMLQEPGSTVKHVKWVWPDCLVGDGQPQNDSSARGLYNVWCAELISLSYPNEYYRSPSDKTSA
jgi:hypothetical protein